MNTTIIRKNATVLDRISGFFADLNESRRLHGVYTRTIRELDSLSNRDLSDIGLHRSEIERVAMEIAYGK